MTNIDQFESVFKAADKPRLQLLDTPLDRLLFVTDWGEAEAKPWCERVRTALNSIIGEPTKTGEATNADRLIPSEELEHPQDLVSSVAKDAPHLICTHRGLRANLADSPYGLGTYLEVLTQATKVPVLVLPETPDQLEPLQIERVMAITDHLSCEHRLVSFAAHMTPKGGRLILTHVEDEAVLERFIAAIAKIPNIDTDTARETIVAQLLQDPKDYIASCRDVLAEHGLHLQIDEIVTVGHRLRDYLRIVAENQVDLVVMNTKDDDQLAMHGLAYPLSVELAETPLLML